MEEITLEQVLEARESRVREQRRLLSEYGAPVISFTMNIPGPVKETPLIRRAFLHGRKELNKALEEAGADVACERVKTEVTGCEALSVVLDDAREIKRLCTAIEDASPLGRLFDMDVIAPNGHKLDRSEVEGGERNCIVCGAKGRGCASRRTHTVEELQTATQHIMESHFYQTDRQKVSDLVTNALLDEVYTTPKPGLVDRNNNGSHRDMTVETFEKSAEALRLYWAHCFDIGREGAGKAPGDTFSLLRQAGLEAERTMYDATHGVNTHKGAIFTLGAVCGAIGRLWRAEVPCRDVDTILRECSAMTRATVEAEFAALSTHPETAETKGQKFYLQYGMRGIRGEVAGALPGISQVAMPKFCSALAVGYARNAAGVYALLALIARGTDTNMVSRGGMTVSESAAKKAIELFDDRPFPSMEDIRHLDEEYIHFNLSPGGCADPSAATYFLYDWSQAD